MERSLPPLVEGDVQATLIVTADEIIWTNTQSLADFSGSFKVVFQWWGDATPCTLFPVNIKHGALVSRQIEKTRLIFHVRTSAGLFSTYLKSTSPLVLTISSVETGLICGFTTIEDCSLVLNSSKYYPILNNCVFLGDLRVHFEHVPNQMILYSDLKLNPHMIHRKPNALKQDTKEHDVLEDVVLRGQSLRAAMLMSTLDFENEPRPLRPLDHNVSDPLIRKLLENPRAPDSLLHKFLLGEELTDLDSESVDQGQRHEESSEPSAQDVSKPSSRSNFTHLSLTLNSVRFTKSGLRKLNPKRESNEPRRTAYYAELSCVGSKRKQGLRLCTSQPNRVTTSVIENGNVVFNTTFKFKLPHQQQDSDGAYSLKHISIKLLYRDRVPVLLGSIEPLPDLNIQDNGPQWSFVQPVFSNNRMLVGHLSLRLELCCDVSCEHESPAGINNIPLSAQAAPTNSRPKPTEVNSQRVKKPVPKTGTNNLGNNERRMGDGIENEEVVSVVTNFIRDAYDHITSSTSSSTNRESTLNYHITCSDTETLLNNYEFSLCVPYIRGLSETSFIEYTFPECLTKPDGQVVHDKLVYTLELGGSRNLHLISLPPAISLAQYLSDMPQSGIMLSLFSERQLVAQSYLLYSQLLSMCEKDRGKVVVNLPTRSASERVSFQLLTLPTHLEFRHFQSTPEESADIALFWKRTCSLSKQFNTEQLTRTLDNSDSMQRPQIPDQHQSGSMQRAQMVENSQNQMANFHQQKGAIQKFQNIDVRTNANQKQRRGAEVFEGVRKDCLKSNSEFDSQGRCLKGNRFFDDARYREGIDVFKTWQTIPELVSERDNNSYEKPNINSYQKTAINSYEKPNISSYQKPANNFYQKPTIHSYQKPTSDLYEKSPNRPTRIDLEKQAMKSFLGERAAAMGKLPGHLQGHDLAEVQGRKSDDVQGQRLDEIADAQGRQLAEEAERRFIEERLEAMQPRYGDRGLDNRRFVVHNGHHHLDRYKEPIGPYKEPVNPFKGPVDPYEDRIDPYKSHIDPFKEPIIAYKEQRHPYKEPIEPYRGSTKHHTPFINTDNIENDPSRANLNENYGNVSNNRTIHNQPKQTSNPYNTVNHGGDQTVGHRSDPIVVHRSDQIVVHKSDSPDDNTTTNPTERTYASALKNEPLKGQSLKSDYRKGEPRSIANALRKGHPSALRELNKSHSKPPLPKKHDTRQPMILPKYIVNDVHLPSDYKYPFITQPGDRRDKNVQTLDTKRSFAVQHGKSNLKHGKLDLRHRKSGDISERENSQNLKGNRVNEKKTVSDNSKYGKSVPVIDPYCHGEPISESGSNCFPGDSLKNVELQSGDHGDLKENSSNPPSSEVRKYFVTSREEYEHLLNIHRKHRFWKYLEAQEKHEEEKARHAKNAPQPVHSITNQLRPDTDNLCNACSQHGQTTHSNSQPLQEKDVAPSTPLQSSKFTPSLPSERHQGTDYTTRCSIKESIEKCEQWNDGKSLDKEPNEPKETILQSRREDNYTNEKDQDRIDRNEPRRNQYKIVRTFEKLTDEQIERKKDFVCDEMSGHDKNSHGTVTEVDQFGTSFVLNNFDLRNSKLGPDSSQVVQKSETRLDTLHNIHVNSAGFLSNKAHIKPNNTAIDDIHKSKDFNFTGIGHSTRNDLTDQSVGNIFQNMGNVSPNVGIIHPDISYSQVLSHDNESSLREKSSEYNFYMGLSGSKNTLSKTSANISLYSSTGHFDTTGHLDSLNSKPCAENESQTTLNSSDQTRRLSTIPENTSREFSTDYEGEELAAKSKTKIERDLVEESGTDQQNGLVGKNGTKWAGDLRGASNQCLVDISNTRNFRDDSSNFHIRAVPSEHNFKEVSKNHEPINEKTKNDVEKGTEHLEMKEKFKLGDVSKYKRVSEIERMFAKQGAVKEKSSAEFDDVRLNLGKTDLKFGDVPNIIVGKFELEKPMKTFTQLFETQKEASIRWSKESLEDRTVTGDIFGTDGSNDFRRKDGVHEMRDISNELNEYRPKVGIHKRKDRSNESKDYSHEGHGSEHDITENKNAFSNRSVRSLSDCELKDVTDENLKEFVAQYVIREISESNEPAHRFERCDSTVETSNSVNSEVKGNSKLNSELQGSSKPIDKTIKIPREMCNSDLKSKHFAEKFSNRANQFGQLKRAAELSDIYTDLLGTTEEEFTGRNDVEALSGITHDSKTHNQSNGNKFDQSSKKIPLDRFLSGEFSGEGSGQSASFEEILEEIYRECSVLDSARGDENPAYNNMKPNTFEISNMRSHLSLPNTSSSNGNQDVPMLDQNIGAMINYQLDQQSDHEAANRNTISEINTSDELTSDSNINNAFTINTSDEITAGHSRSFDHSRAKDDKPNTRDQVEEIIANIAQEDEINRAKEIVTKENELESAKKVSDNEDHEINKGIERVTKEHKQCRKETVTKDCREAVTKENEEQLAKENESRTKEQRNSAQSDKRDQHGLRQSLKCHNLPEFKRDLSNSNQCFSQSDNCDQNGLRQSLKCHNLPEFKRDLSNSNQCFSQSDNCDQNGLRQSLKCHNLPEFNRDSSSSNQCFSQSDNCDQNGLRQSLKCHNLPEFNRDSSSSNQCFSQSDKCDQHVLRQSLKCHNLPEFNRDSSNSNQCFSQSDKCDQHSFRKSLKCHYLNEFSRNSIGEYDNFRTIAYGDVSEKSGQNISNDSIVEISAHFNRAPSRSDNGLGNQYTNDSHFDNNQSHSDSRSEKHVRNQSQIDNSSEKHVRTQSQIDNNANRSQNDWGRTSSSDHTRTELIDLTDDVCDSLNELKMYENRDVESNLAQRKGRKLNIKRSYTLLKPVHVNKININEVVLGKNKDNTDEVHSGNHNREDKEVINIDDAKEFEDILNSQARRKDAIDHLAIAVDEDDCKSDSTKQYWKDGFANDRCHETSEKSQNESNNQRDGESNSKQSENIVSSRKGNGDTRETPNDEDTNRTFDVSNEIDKGNRTFEINDETINCASSDEEGVEELTGGNVVNLNGGNDRTFDNENFKHLDEQNGTVGIHEIDVGNEPRVRKIDNSIVIVDEIKRNDFVLVEGIGSDGIVKETIDANLANESLEWGNQSTYWKYKDVDSTLSRNIQHTCNQGVSNNSDPPIQVSTDNGQFNIYNRTQYGHSLQNSTVFTSIKIKQAQNLPLVCLEGRQLAPTTYVTIENIQNDKQYVWMSPVVIRSVSPIYDVRLTTKIPTSLLYKESEYLVLVVWYKSSTADFTSRDPGSDLVLGFVRISLAPLLTGLPSVRGWFNIVNYSNKICGQLKVSVDPLERIEVEESIVLKLLPEPLNTNISVNCSLCDLKSSVEKIDEKLSRMNDALMGCVDAKNRTRSPGLIDHEQATMTGTTTTSLTAGTPLETATSNQRGLSKEGERIFIGGKKTEGSILFNEEKSISHRHESISQTEKSNSHNKSILPPEELISRGDKSNFHGKEWDCVARRRNVGTARTEGDSDSKSVPSDHLNSLAPSMEDRSTLEHARRSGQTRDHLPQSVGQHFEQAPRNYQIPTCPNYPTRGNCNTSETTHQFSSKIDNGATTFHNSNINSNCDRSETGSNDRYSSNDRSNCHKETNTDTIPSNSGRSGVHTNHDRFDTFNVTRSNSNHSNRDNCVTNSIGHDVTNSDKGVSDQDNCVTNTNHGPSVKESGMSRDFAELRECLENLKIPHTNEEADRNTHTYTIPSLSSSSSSSWGPLLKAIESSEISPPKPSGRNRTQRLDELQNFDMERINKVFRNHKS